MKETKHLQMRVRQRGITNRMIELALEFGERHIDKVKLGSRRIKKLLKTHRDIKSDLLKILDKGGIVVVVSDAKLITAYTWYHS